MAAARGRRQHVVDAAVALVAFALTLGVMIGGGGDAEDARDADALGVVLAALAALPLVVRRRAPLGVFALTALASTVMSGLDYPHGPPVGPTVALFFLAVSPDDERAPRWLTAAVVAGLFAAHVTATGLAQGAFPTVPLLLGVLVWGGAWVVGDRVRSRRDHILELEERAVRTEREAEREQRLAAAEERTRIARDLHDSAGHAINVILVQAGAARLLSERDPARARVAIETIEEIARETVAEIDQLVGALREDGGEAVEPPPGLAALATLVSRHRAAGLDVIVHMGGERRVPTPGVDQAAYRILQESLTNAAKHGAGSAEVEVGFGSRALELTVTNPVPPGRSPAGAGHGIVGMRERAVLLGGTLAAAGADGLFRVQAKLPYSAERQ